MAFHCRNGAGEIVFEWSPELRSPGNPKLYDIHARWNHDVIRELQTQGGKIPLNGEPIKLKGISCHGDSEAGVLLWEEIPVYGHIQFGNPGVLTNIRQ